MKGLLSLLAKHEGPITADFQREYGLRLVDAVVTRTVTEIIDLILWLPDHSAFRASIQTDGNVDKALKLFGWTVDKELMLGLLNVARHQTYVLSQVNSPKKIKPPEEIPGPRGKTPVRKSNDANDIARAMLRAQKGA